MKTTCIPITYDGGCTSILLPQWFDQTTRPNRRRFLKLAAQHRTDTQENQERVRELGELIDEELTEAKKEAAARTESAKAHPDDAAAQAEARKANNRLKAMQDVKTDYTAALEKYK